MFEKETMIFQEDENTYEIYIKLKAFYNFLIKSIGSWKRAIKRDNKIIKSIRIKASIIANNPHYREEAFDRLFAMTAYMIENGNYLKEALIEIKKILIKNKENFTEEDLITFLSILTDILETVQYKRSMLKDEFMIWENGIMGAKYLPASYNPRECQERTEHIEEKMESIRSAYGNKKKVLEK